MKNLLTIIVLSCLAFQLQAQNLATLTPAQQKDVALYFKAKDDSSAKVIRAKYDDWLEKKRSIDSAQNMQIRRDSSDLVTLKSKAAYLENELNGYELVQISPVTADQKQSAAALMQTLISLLNLIIAK